MSNTQNTNINPNANLNIVDLTNAMSALTTEELFDARDWLIDELADPTETNEVDLWANRRDFNVISSVLQSRGMVLGNDRSRY